MKVSELIALLKEQDQEAIVVVSSDEEGNSFRPLIGHSTGSWCADERELYEEEDGYDMSDMPACFVLWP